MAGNSALQGRTVTSKAVTILDAFAGNRTELSMSDLIRTTGLPSSTVHRLIQELVLWGGLERTSRGRYCVGLRLWEIAARSEPSYSLRAAAMPHLQELFDATQQHVQLAVMDGRDAVLIEKLTARDAVPTFGRTGGRLPLHASAVGKVLLAFCPPDLRESVLTSSLPRFTDHTVTNELDLRAQLAEFRRQGFAACRQELSIGVDSCAASIAGPPGARLAAVSVVVPSDSVPLRDVANAVMATARAISHAVAKARPRAAMSAPLTGVALHA